METIYDKTGNGMSSDMSVLIKERIEESTDYVLSIKARLDNGYFELTDEFRDRCVDVNNRALQILYDVRQIPWDKEYLVENNYTNWEGIVEADVVQLQSVCDLMFHYLLEQEDCYPKTLTILERRKKMVSEDEWNKLQREKFLKGFHHLF